ncbi:cuticle protein 19-like [Periplaneta americana]|uniref:cuticle protein 19-like n=1 Tax=Periplaneta americana TaxID=6978 RepID=UPI0037E9B1A0
MAYLIKVVVMAILAAASLGSPVIVSQSYSQSNSGHAISHAPSYSHAPVVTYSHAPVVSYSHAPVVSYSHAPVVSYSHAPVAVHHEPVAVEVEHHAPAHYEFKYGVRDEHTHDIKEQAEKRDGDKVSGYYKLLEADGTTRTVHYTADKHTGFHAQVVRSGHAVHPAQAVKVAVPVHKVVSAPVVSYGLGSYH